MAKARAIAGRRKAVNNIRKITRTMQLIATARYQQSLGRAVGARPYTDKITELVEQVSQAGGTIEHALLRKNESADREAMLLITSNRGLCGGYNANLIRSAMTLHRSVESRSRQCDLYVVGKKGVNYFKFMRRPLTQSYSQLKDAPTFAAVAPIADSFMAAYAEGKYAAIHVVYMKYISAARQTPETIQLLPISAEAVSAGKSATGGSGARTVQYDFSPAPRELLGELLPLTVRVRLFQCFCDAAVSENVARMVAMKSATDAAGDMSKNLSQQYNRARQSQITMELLDIMGGVEALK